jgi:V-type H+-transporting ATPase subunit d
MSLSELLHHNIQDGFLEAVVRGYKSGLLNAQDYSNLCQCDVLDGFSAISAF